MWLYCRRQWTFCQKKKLLSISLLYPRMLCAILVKIDVTWSTCCSMVDMSFLVIVWFYGWHSAVNENFVIVFYVLVRDLILYCLVFVRTSLLIIYFTVVIYDLMQIWFKRFVFSWMLSRELLISAIHNSCTVDTTSHLTISSYIISSFSTPPVPPFQPLIVTNLH